MFNTKSNIERFIRDYGARVGDATLLANAVPINGKSPSPESKSLADQGKSLTKQQRYQARNLDKHAAAQKRYRDKKKTKSVPAPAPTEK